ncbi:zinc finger and BTB domain-containing protein 8A.1-B-like isoform X1 [Neocloeon triangulifer]|uniref:zinc finger and BTB domain-containing protein 8A.1-B-like isoform X1 n=1 Tax=Neocloeon triangulifer TaxID=2078957 RepID=UPI00286F2622|nr:zinc finger and BTB domain-containing protein 8A.1-B-like isoform X1 [Neocloeon triangulifer]
MDYSVQQWLSGVQKVFPAADTVLVVGPEERHFAAHRALLANNSGYLKNLLANMLPDTHTLMLPNIPAECFDVLLTFIYSGYLNVHQHNIYSVLSTAHILQMPQALEVCREFLVKMEQYELACKRTAALTFVFKPVATHKPLPCMLKKNDSIRLGRNVILRSSESLFKSVNKPAAVAAAEKQRKSPKTLQISVETIKDDDSKAGRVILDVACCDGPVRFHRVLNDKYGSENVACPEKIESEGDTTEDDETNTMEHADENSTESMGRKRHGSGKEGGDAVYKCVYCNHTFKSQYCYQKHTRRHINPVTYDVLKLTTNLKEDAPRNKLLDMNVQYYPCKSCGCKFPSYYFVHKHRKICHGEVTENIAKLAEAPVEAPKKTFKSN